MSNADHQRVVLLNRMLSLSASRAPHEHKPPLHSGWELLSILAARKQKGGAVEFLGSLDKDDEAERLKGGAGLNTVRLSQMRFEDHGGSVYATMLVEYVDQALRSFPVVHTGTFAGREIAGKDEERGATSAHVVVKLPPKNSYDDRNYRCAFEYVSPISRLMVERFLSRQLRRHSEAEEWTFGVMATPKGKKAAIEKPYRYNPKVHLVADVGRTLTGSAGKEISQIVFTKRSEKQAIGQPTAVLHQDVYADVEFRVSAKQAPTDSAERTVWFSQVRQYFETRGYDTKLYYRHASGSVFGGQLHRDVANAADLMMCQREIVTLSVPPKKWRPDLDEEMVKLLRGLLDKDGLWQRAM